MREWLLFAKLDPDDHKAVTVADFEESFTELEHVRGHYQHFNAGCDALVVHYDGQSFRIVETLPDRNREAPSDTLILGAS